MPKKIKKINPSLFLTLGGVALLVGAGVAALLVFIEKNNIPENVPVGVELIPQDVVMAASISTDSGQWRQLREYGTPESRAILDQQLANFQNSLLTANGYNYQQDIQPWLGKEVTIAFLPSPPSASTPTAKQAMIMVLPITNPLQAQQLLEKSNSSSKAKLFERTYKGVQIRETPPSSSATKAGNSPISTVVLGQFLIVTNNPKATEKVIDTYQGKVSLAATPGYSEALSKISAKQPFAQVYFNIPVTTALAAANSARSLQRENLAKLQQQQGIATTVTLESEGIRFNSVAWLKADSQRKHVVENKAKTMARRLPSETLLMTSGGNLQQLWQDYLQGAQSNPVLPMSPENLKAGITSTVGLDLEQDLLPWMKGEFSLALIPFSQPNRPDLGAGIVFMVQTSDRSRAEKTLQQLDESMVKKYNFQVQETKINGKTAVNWISPEGGLTATHGWLDGDVAFLTLGAPIAEAIAPKPKKTLAENQLFQQTTQSQLNPNNGHFFIDVDRTINSGNLALLQFLPNLKPLTSGMKAIGVTAAVADQRTSRFEIFVLLKKVGQPTPLPK